MKITMIGDQMVGKTTFMMSTYGLMQGQNVTGFTLKCKDESAHNRLIQAYNHFRSTGEYPPPTVQMTEYEYVFYNKGEEIMEFSWVDIRGESIHDYDQTELSNQLADSQAMMLFLNGYDIINGADISEQMDDILILMNNTFLASDKPKLIMVVFTQCDRIPDFDGPEYDKLKESIAELEKLTDGSDSIGFATVPIACSLDCMMDLDYVMAALMVFGYALDAYGIQQHIEARQAELREMYGSGFLRELVDTFGFDFKRNKVRAQALALQPVIDAYNDMVDKFEALKKFVDDYKLGTSYSIPKRYSSKNENPYEW